MFEILGQDVLAERVLAWYDKFLKIGSQPGNDIIRSIIVDYLIQFHQKQRYLITLEKLVLVFFLLFW